MAEIPTTHGADLPGRHTAPQPVTGTDLPDAALRPGVQTGAEGRVEQTTDNVIPFPVEDHEQDDLPDGSVVMRHVRGRWRAPAVERLRAEADTKRVEVERAGKERL